MKLTILNPIEKPEYKDVLHIKLTFMLGDADGYVSESFYINPKHPELKRFLTFIETCQKEYPNGRGGGGSHEYNHVKDFEYFTSWEEGKGSEDLAFEWPYDHNCDCQASMDRIKITYYDKNGVEHICHSSGD